MKEFIVTLAIGFILGMGLMWSLNKHDSAKLQVKFGEVIVAMETNK